MPTKQYVVELAGFVDPQSRMIDHLDPRVTLDQLCDEFTLLLLAPPLFLHVFGHQESGYARSTSMTACVEELADVRTELVTMSMVLFGC